MVFVVERYLPGTPQDELRRSLERLHEATEELRTEGIPVWYLGSTVVPEDEACFCQFEGPSQEAIAEANRRAGTRFDRIVAAVALPTDHDPNRTIRGAEEGVAAMTLIQEQAVVAREGFPSPFEVPIPPECEGWEEMYSYFDLFSEERRAFDESRCWFQLTSHYAEPFYPFDSIFVDYATFALNQVSSRIYVVPPSLGLEVRILNGYFYLSPNSITDEATLALRAELFAKRGGFTFEHWDELLVGWERGVGEAIDEVKALEVPVLPELEDESMVTEGRALGSGHTLLHAYDRLLEGFDRICHYHMQFQILAHGANVSFYGLCRQAFPGISDQTVARMVAGIDTVILRPDDELRRLARLALELGVGDAVKEASGDEEALRRALAASEAGERWLADLEQTKDPWFYFSYGNGCYHHHRSWVDDTTLPLATIGSYVGRLEAGEDISRPQAAIAAERERIADEYRALLPTDLQHAFDEQLTLCRTVFPHVESHGFYVDHWYHTLFWNKVREFGTLLARHGFLADAEDVFFLQHGEVRTALEEIRVDWGTGGAGQARGPHYWPPIVERRKAIYGAMREWAPPPALGNVPETITDPVTIMLFGITTERVQEWLDSGGEDDHVLKGFAGSPGVAEGTARVVLSPDRLRELEEGEILIAPFTSPSWAPVFGTIAGAVLDAGGIMSHAAIVAREYGLPAVVGTGTATKRIKTGDRVHVDGSTGVVTILDGADAGS